MQHNVKIVIGANYGDEGKGLMTDYFAAQAVSEGKKALVMVTISDNIVTGEAMSADARRTSYTNMMDVAFDIISQC